MRKDPRQDDAVIEQTRNGNDVADEIERKREVGESARQQCNLRGRHLTPPARNVGQNLVGRDNALLEPRKRFRT